MHSPRGPAAYVVRDFTSALNVFREPPTDGIVAATEETREACLRSPTCARAACLIQIVFSLLLLIGTVMFTKDSVLALPMSPIVEPKNAKNPAPALISDLFARAASGDIASLSCPCSRAQHEMSNVTAALDFKMDSFADAYDYPKTLTEMKSSFDASVSSVFGLVESCVQNLTKLSADLAALLPDLLDIPPDSYSYYYTADMIAYYFSHPRNEVSLSAAICEFAFGMRAPTTAALAPKMRTRSKANFDLRAPCSDSAAPLLPFRLSPLKAADFPFLQAERGLMYEKSLGVTISTLSLFASQLRDSIKAATFSTQSAVSPEQLQQLVQRTWEQEFGSAGVLAGNLVPGFFAGEATFFETNLAAAYSAIYFSSAAALSDTSFLFSNPLPFGRADFGPSVFFPEYGRVDTLGGDFFYLIADDGSREMVASAGEARLRISVPTLEESFFYPKTFPEISSSEASAFVRNDFITLLDACANNASLSVELLSWYPTYTPEAASFQSVYSSFFQGSFNRTALNRERSCAKFSPYAPRAPFITVPVTCPTSLVELGKKRLASKLSTPAFDSHLRGSFESLVFSKLSATERTRLISLIKRNASELFDTTSLSAADATLVNKSKSLLLAGFSEPNDLRARASILSTLLIDSDSVNVTADPLKYYASCAPALCAWIETSTRSDCESHFLWQNLSRPLPTF
jgi:hypothetical protein